MITPSSPPPPAVPAKRMLWELRSEKIKPAHVERLAVVYVRQSTPQQVLDHQESTRLQYGLRTRAVQWGWPEERVLVIDDDLGKSGATAEGRVGFQRLVSEVSLGHVGIIMGIEMSRLARSCKDWHQLLEVCALFSTLIADLDGVYDPVHYNDRLLLGLKGTMSEAELHMIRQRLDQGRINKARRGELALPLPVGYVRRADGEVTLDPHEEVQSGLRLVFRVFDELGTVNATLRYLVKNKVQFAIRVRSGLAKGELEWRRPIRATLREILRNPTYAGAYAYGRMQVDPRRKKPGRLGSGLVPREPDQWIALLKDRLPAYISWEQYEQNQARLKSNRSRRGWRGTPRRGPSLLVGLLVCAKCGQRMVTSYFGQQNHHYYMCATRLIRYGGKVCQIVSGRALDQFVSSRALEALAPASLELSLEAATNMERERRELDRVWQQRVERSHYEAERAARQYRLVEPENRLVARQLEREWEEKLVLEKNLEEEYHRFREKRPRVLSQEEREAIRKLAGDIPALWEAPTTTNQDRKEILRQIIDEVRVDAQGKSERVGVVIQWAGGTQTTGVVLRPVVKTEDLSYYPQLCQQVRALTAQGKTAVEIAEQLTQEGYRSPKAKGRVCPTMVSKLWRDLGLAAHRSRSKDRIGLQENEWWLPALAKEIGMPTGTLDTWRRESRVIARQQKGRYGRWVIWADPKELERLKALYAQPHPERSTGRELGCEPGMN